jgi:hypothetical protein
MAGLCAGGLGLVAASNQAPGLPAPVPWFIVLAALLATPAVIGGLGAVSGRGSLLAAAGILCLVQSVLSFSGVTLVLLLPGLIFLRAAAAVGAPRWSSGPEAVRPFRWLALTVLAVPVALVVVLNLGIFGIVGFVALAGLTPALRSRRTTPVAWRGGLIGIATVGLVLSAAYTAFANTQTICWNIRSTGGGLVYERVAVQEESGPVGGDTGTVGSGCAGGQPTIEGAALTGILVVGAVAVAAAAAWTPGVRAVSG